MIADAMDGKINLIVTKSVSCFARNTVDSLTTIRQLKENGIEVYFEKEDIKTAKNTVKSRVLAVLWVDLYLICRRLNLLIDTTLE